jgi:hypothetical protein
MIPTDRAFTLRVHPASSPLFPFHRSLKPRFPPHLCPLSEDGNLTHGWQIVNGTAAPHGAPCGGPSFRYNPTDGRYYILTGGREVYLYRSSDLQNWEESNPSPFIVPTAGDGLISNLTGFTAAEAARKGSPPNSSPGVREPYAFVPFLPDWRDNWRAWSKNSNDADMCCMHANVSQSYVLWGASGQGGHPDPPLTGSDGSTNVLASAPMPLDKLLMLYFADD